MNVYIYIEHKVCALRRVDDEYDEKIWDTIVEDGDRVSL